jgi:hypothetical protein
MLLRGWLIIAAAAVAVACARPAPASREEAMAETIRIQENTQAQVGSHLVGVGNVFERELDEGGTRVRRMSARLAVFDPVTEAERAEIVRAGSTLVLGSERFRVSAVDPGSGEVGSVTLQKVAP